MEYCEIDNGTVAELIRVGLDRTILQCQRQGKIRLQGISGADLFRQAVSSGGVAVLAGADARYVCDAGASACPSYAYRNRMGINLRIALPYAPSSGDPMNLSQILSCVPAMKGQKFNH
jgi:hypothetical protein